MDTLNSNKGSGGNSSPYLTDLDVPNTTKDVDYKDGNEPTNEVSKISKLEVKIEGSLSSIYTKALMDILNKQTGVNEYQLDQDELPTNNTDKETKTKKEKKNVSKESQQESDSVSSAASIITNDLNYYKKLDDESIDPSYFYSYIGKNTDINDSESVINTINRIVNGYNKKYKENNLVVLENNGIKTKSIVMLEAYLNQINLSIHFVTPSNSRLPAISYITQKLGVSI